MHAAGKCIPLGLVADIVHDLKAAEVIVAPDGLPGFPQRRIMTVPQRRNEAARVQPINQAEWQRHPGHGLREHAPLHRMHADKRLDLPQ
ncbi:MAG: hypothetical protein U5L11_02380 [Arhodomonas sp.]|nr:hypothetical protein [Arhodomonas sp.]